VLHRLLDEYAPTFTPEERSAAAVAFGGEILHFAAGNLTTPSIVALLRRACEVFPQSAKLANLFGQSLLQTGETDEALQQLSRALSLRQAAVLNKLEFPNAEGPALPGQIAEHIQTWERSASV